MLASLNPSSRADRNLIEEVIEHNPALTRVAWDIDFDGHSVNFTRWHTSFVEDQVMRERLADRPVLSIATRRGEVGMPAKCNRHLGIRCWAH